MAKITVTLTGFTNFVERQMSIIRDISDRQLEAIAKETATRIQFHILASIKRQGSTGNLAEAFFAEQTSLTSWGVGKISHLNKAAPYWRWINYGVAGTGRRIPPGTDENPRIKGHFEPNDFGRFTKGSPRFRMNPTKPIQPHNFIQRTLDDQNVIISSVLQRIKI